jgi:maltose alpha-D-glucosyltransferase/alpha-amylase
MLERFRHDIEGLPAPVAPPCLSATALLEASESNLPAVAEERLASYLPAARLLGQRTGELHRALGAAVGHAHLAPESYSRLYQRSAYQRLRGLTCSVLESLRVDLSRLPAAWRRDAEQVIAAEGQLLARFRRIMDRRLTAMRIAGHGNYHLEEILRTGDDFTIIDFEGEPPRPLFERRLKRSPLVDVASMLRSFHYAARVALPDEDGEGGRPDTVRGAQDWSRFWRHWVGAVFLQAYFSTVDRGLLPPKRDDLCLLLEIGLLERTLYELGHELTHRPDWVHIPLRDIRDLLHGSR